jgi:hypothetical protein
MLASSPRSAKQKKSIAAAALPSALTPPVGWDEKRKAGATDGKETEELKEGSGVQSAVAHVEDGSRDSAGDGGGWQARPKAVKGLKRNVNKKPSVAALKKGGFAYR